MSVTVTPSHIVAARMAAQRINTAENCSVQEMIAWLGAVQAQDAQMCKWAVGLRTGLTDAEVAAALDEGHIVRTHVLRPTWHLAAAADVRNMLRLTAPRIRTQYMSYARSVGYDEAALNKFTKAIGRMLRDGNYMSRDEIMARLKIERVGANDFSAALIMMGAELDMVVCNGPVRDKQQTYALMDERLPATPVLKADEAAAQLAERYYRSHGPATIKDFVWWSGLTVKAATAATNAVRNKFTVWVHDDVEYLVADAHAQASCAGTIHLLPAFDEYLISYADRTAAIDKDMQAKAFTRNGIFKPVIVADGRVVGIWKRVMEKNGIALTVEYFGKPDRATKAAVSQRIAEYSAHHGMACRLT